MSNIEFIDGTVRVGDIAHITQSQYDAVEVLLTYDKVQQAVNHLVVVGFSPSIAELIVYELI
jgi:hypothetical protein